ncbi:hypothetical protein GCM10011328_05730 [Hafnia psychrotolerans]|uniref:Uncharacterized protein n=2 Tax=Hafnia psychrotolerans TaxID=1477018 RepID=A0ABQ1G0M5_9GAMM|nr:hypothetical protein GCM10011328_05730 [Hafnia psychrotolerans]
MQTTFYAANDEQGRRDIIYAAHTEALKFNDSFSVLYNRTDCMDADIWLQADEYDRHAAFEMAHAEALEINDCVNFNRQQAELAAEQQRAVLERLEARVSTES